MKPGPVVLLIIGGILLGLGLGALVHEAITRLNGQTGAGEGMYGAVAGLGLALMILAGWLRRTD